MLVLRAQRVIKGYLLVSEPSIDPELGNLDSCYLGLGLIAPCQIRGARQVMWPGITCHFGFPLFCRIP